ncbi:DUF2235 domain-containing protein [Rhizobium sp. BK251]|uniref:DUF2235 domain-containing protein n=1 Tax=Rhizobium sp. BK251 TaxID=2512125 RepID=UPI00104289FC|nr:DUF2235 domain-containing protein [Rhizobium sp. BK251]TCL74709.1 putative alpha/beta hydrolase family protein DUF2235 [Rhizobium sp. BK251]
MNLIVCSDGTWNTPDEMEAGLPSPTNVVKLYNALGAADKDGEQQKSYYHPGVGTDGTWWDKALGGGTGKGLDQNIMSAYFWLARNYSPGDRIWLFGFSRGAYTVRSLGGMISKCGLLKLGAAGSTDTKDWNAVDTVFQAYRASGPSKIVATRAMPFHNTDVGNLPSKQTPLHFIGVWDTVGSLGIPDDLVFLNLLDNPNDHRFHDTKLSDIVVHARHAVALDEIRQSFIPTLWEGNATSDLKQLWFPGAHGDVGGGYGHCGLSDGALYWMIEEATAAGLFFRQNVLQQLKPDARGLLHNSVNGVFKALKTRPRAAPVIDAQMKSPGVHASAMDRHVNSPLDQGRFWPLKTLPVTVDVYARDKWNYTGIFLKKGKNYKLTAKGQWMDGSIACGPAGTRDGNFQASEIAHIASSVLGSVETIVKKVTRNQQVDFWWTRREEDIDWLALVGLVANDVPPPKKKASDKSVERLPHEVFVIGDGCTFTPKGDGYLYCFANDAWHAYDNNRGSIRLTIEEA